MKSRFYLLLLCVPLVAALSVPFYNRATPTLGGWPFFYWWQTACVFAGALLTGLVCLLDTKAARDADSGTVTSPGEYAA
jgi:hypothetical protein